MYHSITYSIAYFQSFQAGSYKVQHVSKGRVIDLLYFILKTEHTHIGPLKGQKQNRNVYSILLMQTGINAKGSNHFLPNVNSAYR